MDYLNIDQAPAGDGTFCILLCILLFNLMQYTELIAGYEVRSFQQNARKTELKDPDELSRIVLQ
jgi:hypothetical protein